MATKSTRSRKITQLFEYIYGLKDKCDSINDINKNLITEYCRFAVMTEETSQKIQDKLDGDPAELKALLEQYKEFNKILIALYKTLKFDVIKEELKDEKNPFMALLKEAKENGDL